jgi:GWxTD domain-containing protein
MAFDADIASSFTTGGKTMARVYVEVPYRSIRFSREGSRWAARVEVTILIYDRKGQQLTGDLWTMAVESEDPDRDSQREFRRRFDLEVEPGRLRAEIKVAQVGSGREGTWTREFEVPRYAMSPLSLSDFVFGRCDRDSSEAPDGWSEGRFEPSPRRRYGESQPVVCVFGEIYDNVQSADTSYSLTYEVLGAERGDRWTHDVTRSGRRGTFIIYPSIADLAAGVYRLKLTARLGNEEIEREGSFEIDESRLDIFGDPDMIRGTLSYIASGEEQERLETLPPDSLLSFWDEFWLRRDPTPDTERNENLLEFVKRIRHATAAFSILGAGWSSDMGRIHIKYGEPDEIEKIPAGAVGPPREIWHYFDRRRSFIFVDTEGFGRYRLIGLER